MMPQHDWEILRKLRKGFLRAEDGLADYWETPAQLELYDRFFAERIGWKWDAVLAELTQRGFIPDSTQLVDWGCGSGMASRRFLGKFPAVEKLTLWDRSTRALDCASAKSRTSFPHVALLPWNSKAPTAGTWLLSHIINELSDDELSRLLEILQLYAETIIWVEPGTHAASRRLISVREKLLTGYSALGPCPHDGICGLLTSENQPHWCHHFTRPPGWVHHDSDWSAFARELEIDLGTVPYSWLALSKRAVERPEEKILGRPRFFKGHAKLLTCEAPGVSDKVLQKRDDPARFKALQKS